MPNKLSSSTFASGSLFMSAASTMKTIPSTDPAYSRHVLRA